jgi:hypothetical protein
LYGLKNLVSHITHFEREAGEECIMRSFINNFYVSPNIIMAIESRRVRWAGNVA